MTIKYFKVHLKCRESIYKITFSMIKSWTLMLPQTHFGCHIRKIIELFLPYTYMSYHMSCILTSYIINWQSGTVGFHDSTDVMSTSLSIFGVCSISVCDIKFSCSKVYI